MNHPYEDDGKPMCGRCGRPANDRVHVARPEPEETGLLTPCADHFSFWPHRGIFG